MKKTLDREPTEEMLEGRFKPLYSTAQLATMQAKLAERDKLLEQREATILEQQKTLNAIRPAGKSTLTAQWVALESALKSERLAGKIEGLEEAADLVDRTDLANLTANWQTFVAKMLCAFSSELRRMAAELKGGK